MIDDLESIAQRIRKAREIYKPSNIKCVLVAESPPASLSRFFYYPDVKCADYLFLGVMEALYPEEKEHYLLTGRQTQEKEHLLRRFQSNGFYLLDVLDVPIQLHRGSLATAVPTLIRRLQACANLNTPIILIKTSTYDAAFAMLQRAGYTKIAPNRIPFPGQGWQRDFQSEFREALKFTLT